MKQKLFNLNNMPSNIYIHMSYLALTHPLCYFQKCLSNYLENEPAHFLQTNTHCKQTTNNYKWLMGKTKIKLKALCLFVQHTLTCINQFKPKIFNEHSISLSMFHYWVYEDSFRCLRVTQQICVCTTHWIK